MTAPVRVAGRATTIDGATVVWSRAEGSRGTRWREALTRDAVLTRGVLLEVARDGRTTRLEVTTGAGMLTLHPDADEGELHGNVVGQYGVSHLAYSWSPAHTILLLGSPASAAVGLGRLAGTIEPGQSLIVPMLRIDDRLEPTPVSWLVERRSVNDWRLGALDGSEERLVALDAGGFPMLADAVSWPLERDDVETVWTEAPNATHPR